MILRPFEWSEAKQLSVLQMLLAFALPSAFAFIGFRVVLPKLVSNGTPVMIAWPSVAAFMLFIFVVVGIILLWHEARQLKITLASRMCLKKLKAKQWFFYGLLIIIGLFLSIAASQLVAPFIKITGLSIPDYMPFFLNPSIDPINTDPAILSPGLPLKGQYGLLPLISIVLLLNILAEELYFRAWILPKSVKYGHLGWILNAFLFAFYHSFQLWLFPIIIVISLVIAFIIYRSRSIWPALVGHLVGNFLISVAGIIVLIFG